MGQIILWIVALLVGIVLTIIASEPIHYLLARRFGGLIPHPPRGVTGIWEASYSYKIGFGGGQVKEEHQLIELKQFDKYVAGRVLIGQAHIHRFRGKVQLELYFTGTWESIRPGEINHGAFQLVINTRGDRMRGKWLGFNYQNIVQHGPWKWRLRSRKLGSETRTKLIAKFKQKHTEVVSLSQVVLNWDIVANPQVGELFRYAKCLKKTL